MGLLAIIGQLRHLMYKFQIDPSKIKITIEFLDYEAMSRAEFALRTNAQGIHVDTKLTDGICAGNQFEVMGIKMQAKEPPQAPKLRNCNCPYCRSGTARRNIDVV